ncbi:MAG: CCA tRNA nucleotidyltransferase [Planctomycetota bacterium]
MSDATDKELIARAVVEQLRGAGHEALYAGGCVRDRLLGREPKDYDVATSATPDQVREVFGKRRTLAVGAAFGVIAVLTGRKGDDPIEVATFRSDADYTDGRRPDRVEFTTAEHDAQRRDFTVNGLFFDPIEQRVIDYVGGEADMQAKRLRAIGNAADRIAEDKLRMLRAVRFAATLGFEIEPATSHAVRESASDITVVSAERIGAELRRMLTHESAPRAVWLLAEHHLLGEVAPEFPGDAGSLAHFAALHDHLSVRTMPTVLACLLGPHADAETASRRAFALKLTRKEADRVGWLVEHRSALEGADSRRWSEVQPALVEGGEELVAVHEAFAGGPDDASRFCREKLALPADELDPPPLVTGGDLVAAGRRPGPEFAALLRRARVAQLDAEVATKAEALKLLAGGR